MSAPRFASVEDLVDDARSRLDRVSVDEAARMLDDGALLVDIRPDWQRVRDGEIPGALVVDRNHLEWRLHPESGSRVEQAAPGRRWIVFCTEGYTSSLAADSLNSIGVPATDLVGGITAWAESGRAVVAGGTEPGHVTPG